jgi:4-hydroxyacetophenone monooxygenase
MTDAHRVCDPIVHRRFRDAAAIANIPVLLMVLVQLTGEMSWLQEPFRPQRAGGLEDNDTGGLDVDVQHRVRAAALDAIVDWWSGRTPMAIPQPSPDLLVRMLSWSMNEPVPSEYGPMMAADLEASQRPAVGAATRPPAEKTPSLTAIVIGAGVSGICAALAFQREGIPYTIIERNPEPGGTWWENKYPGAGIDTPNHLYSFSGIPHDWQHYFASREELFGYLQRVANEYGIREHVRLETTALAAVYGERDQMWTVDCVDAHGRASQHTANILITGVGGFNTPKTPAISGLETFTGPVLHTARWPEDARIDGEDVAVVGNGASAMQLVPAIADKVNRLTIFQRSPQWAAPFPQFHARVPDPVRFLIGEVPLYQWWYRTRLHWTFNDRLHASLQRDPSWPHADRSLNAINDAHRRYFTRYVKAEVGDRQDLLPKLLPTYPPYGKRILLDNGWYKTLLKDNVELVAEPLSHVRGNTLLTPSGGEYHASTVIMATGFDVVRFLSTLDIRGRNGQRIADVWDGDDGRAYLGCAVPGFPNMFCLYGPNTQPGHGGSIIWSIEAQVHYIIGLLRQMEAGRLGAIECRQDVCAEHNAEIDERHAKMVWTHPLVDTYYRNARGRVVVNSPFRNVDYWYATRESRLDDYILEPAARQAVTDRRSK